MLTYAQCEACSGIMFLTLVEPHYTLDHINFRSFECADCTAVAVLIVGERDTDRIRPIYSPTYWQRRWRFESLAA